MCSGSQDCRTVLASSFINDDDFLGKDKVEHRNDFIYYLLLLFRQMYLYTLWVYLDK